MLRFKRLGSTSTLFRAFGACVLDAAAGAMFTPRITGSQSANARNQQTSEPCNLQIIRKKYIFKLNKQKKANFQQSWSLAMHQIALEELPDTTCTSERASTSRCYNFLPPDLSLSISKKKTEKLPETSGSTCLQTVPHGTKTKLQATLTTTRITPLQFSKWAMKKQTKKNRGKKRVSSTWEILPQKNADCE